MAYPLTVLQPKRSRIRWKRSAVAALLGSQRPGSSAGSGRIDWSRDEFGALTYAIATSSLTVLEDWSYADAAARAAAWATVAEFVCGGNFGGFGGANAGQSFWFCGSIGDGNGYLYYQRTFSGLPAGHHVLLSCAGTRNVDTAFQPYGMQVADFGGVSTTSAPGATLFQLDPTVSAGGELTILLGQFSVEFGLGSETHPIVNTFGPLYLRDLDAAPGGTGPGGQVGGGGGEDEGGGSGGSGYDAEGYCNLQFAFPMERAFSRERPRSDSAFVQLGGLGGADAAISGRDQLVTGTVHFIPTRTGLVMHPTVPATGWDDHCGWQLFLAYAYAGGVFEFYPDASVPTGDASMHLCQLERPTGGPPAPAAMSGRALTLTMRDVEGVAFDGW